VYRGLTAVAKELRIGDITELWNKFVKTNDLQPGGEKFVQYLTALRRETPLIIDVPLEGGGLASLGYTQDISGLHVDFMESSDDAPLGSPFPGPPGSPPGFWETPPGSPRRQKAEEEQRASDEYRAKQEEARKTEQPQ
jgi:hypothetical protein